MLWNRHPRWCTETLVCLVSRALPVTTSHFHAPFMHKISGRKAAHGNFIRHFRQGGQATSGWGGRLLRLEQTVRDLATPHAERPFAAAKGGKKDSFVGWTCRGGVAVLVEVDPG